jgi:hypothetical protein
VPINGLEDELHSSGESEELSEHSVGEDYFTSFIVEDYIVLFVASRVRRSHLPLAPDPKIKKNTKKTRRNGVPEQFGESGVTDVTKVPVLKTVRTRPKRKGKSRRAIVLSEVGEDSEVIDVTETPAPVIGKVKTKTKGKSRRPVVEDSNVSVVQIPALASTGMLTGKSAV